MSFPDPDEERTWVFDVTFLASRWTCIYGDGCQGVLTEAAPELVQGCCSYGAHFTGRKDRKRVEQAALTLTDDQWQYRSRGLRAGVVKKNASDEWVTRMVGGACIFLNRPGFPGGPGCALHRASVERGVAHLTLKPDVCWQLPLRREDGVDDDGSVTSTIRQWDRRDWGAGGAEFHWWCTESPEAFTGSVPVYKYLKDELVAMTSATVYRMLAAYLARHAEGAIALPHPAVRRR